MKWPTKKVGVIGWPIDHSISPQFHNAAFAALGMTDWQYDKIAIPPDILRLSLRELVDHGYVGCNVTVPFKEEVLPLVRPDDIAKRIGAVNTIDLRSRLGTNTDMDGFIADLAAHEVPVSGERVLILGAGGSARAVAYGLAQAGATLGIVNRTHARAEKLAADVGVQADALTRAEAPEFGASLIVNCTSMGMFPHADKMPWPDDVPFPQGVTVYDVVYRPTQTRLMALAEAHGGRAIGGLGMLVRQGAAAFKLWTQVEPPLDVMLQAAEAALNN